MNAELTRAERLTLIVLNDGEWHKGRRWDDQGGAVLATTAANLYRRGYAERTGASRTINPRNPGYSYRITPAGRAALAAARNHPGERPPR